MSAIHTLDLDYLGIPQAVAAFVIFDRARGIGPVLVETGPASTLPVLIERLKHIGVEPADIRHALVTHIHLDHAGAAGELAQRFGTHIHVHEFGVKHLIDPAKLIDSATRIYGDQMDRLWGRVLPVPAGQIHAVRDGDVLDLDDVQLRAIETPGHARHHHAFALEIDGAHFCFAGDAAGFNARAASPTFVSIPTPPPEFDLEAWRTSIDRLRAERFNALHLTHFGRVDDVDAHLARVAAILPPHVTFINARLTEGLPREAILREYIEWNQADAASHGIGERDFMRYVSRNLLTMNVDGMLRYLSKTAR